MNRSNFAFTHFPIALATLFFAIPSGAQTVSAASCSQSAVQAAITGAARGGTVTVPAGTCTWSGTVTITKGLTLNGAGPGKTVITNGTGDGTVLEVDPDSTAIANSESITISGFTIDGNGTGYNLVAVNGAPYNSSLPYRNIVIFGNTFQNTGSSSGAGNNCLSFHGQVRGVVYGNTFDRCEFPWRSFGNDDMREFTNSAFYPVSYGSSDNLYIEDNAVQYSTAFNSTENGAGWIESGQGGRWVVRFNTWNMANATGQAEFWDIHGDQNFEGGSINGQSSTMISEFYGNSITNGASSVYRWMDLRGSWGMLFDNSYSGASAPAIEVNQYSDLSLGNAGCYNLMLFPTGSTYSGPDPSVANSYFFNNKVNGTLKGAVAGSTNGCGVAENGALSAYGTGVLYGWWNQTNSFNGTVGVGRGPKASMPSTCTTGVGYLATDEGSWNTKLPANTSGRFYKCTATNTWALYYTPYTYPHPLRSGSQAAAPAPPINVTAVAQ